MFEGKPLIIPSEGVSLEGALHLPPDLEPAGLLIVCHPHPQYGGSMENNVVHALCDAALQEGLAALRFNFRGVGRSGGSYEDGRGERKDVHAVLAAAATLPGGARVGLAGYSFGAAMAAQATRSESPSATGVDAPVTLLLVSPPLQMLGARDLRACRASLLLVTGDLDPICPADALEALGGRLDPPADCQVIEGADHSWLGYEAALRDVAGSYLRWHLAARH